MIRPIAPNRPLTDWPTFTKRLEAFSAESLVAGFNQFAWSAYHNEFPEGGNRLSVALAGSLAALGLAYGSCSGERATLGDIEDLHYDWIAIEGVREDLFDAQAQEFLRLTKQSDLSHLFATLEKARAFVKAGFLCKTYRQQLLHTRQDWDELLRLGWLADRLAHDGNRMKGVDARLGMEQEVFFMSALALSALAQSTRGVLQSQSVDEDTSQKFGINKDTLALVRNRLAIGRRELRQRFELVSQQYQEGLRQFAPSPLLTNPLLDLEEVGQNFAVMPSIHHFNFAVRDWVREALADRHLDFPQDTYGDLLEDYAAATARACGTSVLRVDEHQARNTKRADLILRDDNVALVIEIKRSIATGQSSRTFLSAQNMFDTTCHLYDAYQQCIASQRYFRTRLKGVVHWAFLLLVDEPIGLEGCLLASLMRKQSNLHCPFDVLSITEFENALPVVGPKGIARLINRKWRELATEMTLAEFARRTGITTCTVQGKRLHLEQARDRVLGPIAKSYDLDAAWP